MMTYSSSATDFVTDFVTDVTDLTDVSGLSFSRFQALPIGDNLR
ncbi:hypothetical protein Q5689_29365 [Microcoleus sp. ARI1-A2]